MTLAESILAVSRTLTYQVRINGVLLMPSNPTSATGTPGVGGVRISKSFDSPVPVCEIMVNRIPSWVRRGQSVTVDIGYDGFTQRRFKGTVQDRARGVEQSVIRCMGNLWKAFRTVEIPERSVDGLDVGAAIEGLLDSVGITARNVNVPAFTLGTASDAILPRGPIGDMLAQLMDIKDAQAYEIGSGQVIVRVIDFQPAPTAFKSYSSSGGSTSPGGIADDMTGEHPGCIEGTGGYDWEFGPVVQNATPPGGDPDATGWAMMVWDCDSVFLPNVSVEVRDFALWSYGSGGWERVSDEIFGSQENDSNFGPTIYSDEGAGPIFDTPTAVDRGIQIFTPQEPWPVGTTGLWSTYRARLVKTDESGPDNLDAAFVMMNAGADWWNGVPDGAGVGKFHRLTREFQTMNFTTVPDATLLADPPPIGTVANPVTTPRVLDGSDREDPTYFRDQVTVTGATIVTGTPPDETSSTLEITATLIGANLQQPPAPAGAFSAAQFSNDLIDTIAELTAYAQRKLARYARVPREISLELPGDPQLDQGQTLAFDVPQIDVTGNWFVFGITDELSGQGYRTLLELRGGDETGGTVSISPFAAFTYTSEQEVIADAVKMVITFDASSSLDPDGVIVSWAWSGDIAESGEQVTVVIDPAAFPDGLEVTLTVTDSDGLTDVITQTIPVDPLEAAEIVIPAIYAAMNSHASASADGGQNWNDQAGATCISVGARPADGVNTGHACFGYSDGSIKRTTDHCVSALTTVLAAVGSPIKDIQWDWRNTNVVWAVTDDCRVYISIDAGITWGLYDNLRTKLGLAGALGNKIGLPAGNAVFVFGGTGAGQPLIAFVFDAGASHDWIRETFTGHLATDIATPADATMRIVDHIAPGHGMAVIILAWASGGAGTLVAIYSSESAPGARNWTRATGLTAGLKNGRYVVGDALFLGRLFHAAFGDRDVWSSDDGIAWTEASDVMPVGVTPNHAIFLSDVLTGIPGMMGCYIVAAENAGSTLGIYKSTDGLASVQALRPATGFDAWPAGAKAKMISIGAPGSTVSAPGGLLAKLSDNETIEQWDGSSSWTVVGGGYAGGFIGKRLFHFANGHWLIQADHSGDGEIHHSSDGVTWAVTLGVSGNSGVHGMDILSDGSIFAVRGDDSTADGAQATNPLRIYKSTDFGQTWTLVHTDAGYGASRNTRPKHNSEGSSIVCDKWGQKIFVPCRGDGTGEPECIYSEDAGATWARRIDGTVDEVPGVGGAHFMFVNNGRVMATVGNVGPSTSLQYSDDLGITWVTVTAPDLGSADGAIAPYRPSHFNRLVVGTKDSVFISQDNGDTWTVVPVAAIDFDTSEIGSVEYDPAFDRIVVARRHSVAGGDVRMIEGAFGGSPTLTDISFNSDGSQAAAAHNVLAYPR